MIQFTVGPGDIVVVSFEAEVGATSDDLGTGCASGRTDLSRTLQWGRVIRAQTLDGTLIELESMILWSDEEQFDFKNPAPRNPYVIAQSVLERPVVQSDGSVLLRWSNVSNCDNSNTARIDLRHRGASGLPGADRGVPCARQQPAISSAAGTPGFTDRRWRAACGSRRGRPPSGPDGPGIAR